MSSRDVLITGASSRFGLTAARKFAEHGYRVFGAALDISAIESVPGIVPITLDLTLSNSIREASNFVLSETGGIGILIHGADYGKFGFIEESSLSEARRQMEVNVFGAMELTQFMLPAMRELGKGRIVNIASLLGEREVPLGGWYHASKCAFEVLSNSLRKEVRQYGIDVVVVQPAFVSPEWCNEAIENLLSSSDSVPYAAIVQAQRELFSSSPVADKEGSINELSQIVFQAATTPSPKAQYYMGGTDLSVALLTLTPERIDALARFRFARDTLAAEPSAEEH